MPTPQPPCQPPVDEPIDPSLLQTMQESVESQLQQERGPIATMRSWPTHVRRLVLMVVVAGITLVGALRGQAHLGAAFALALAGGTLAWMSLRPLHRPALPRFVQIAVPIAAMAGVVLLALLSPDAASSGWIAHLRCFAPGMGTAALTLLVWRLLTRRPSGFHALAGAAAAGLGANAFLAGGCQTASPNHLLFGHASVLLVVVAVVWMVDLVHDRST